MQAFWEGWLTHINTLVLISLNEVSTQSSLNERYIEWMDQDTLPRSPNAVEPLWHVCCEYTGEVFRGCILNEQPEWAWGSMEWEGELRELGK